MAQFKNMKQIKIFSAVVVALVCVTLFASNDTLTLVWNQPPGWTSTLYTSTNLTGTWTPIGPISPPVLVETTNQQAFFYVFVAPPSHIFIYTNDPVIEGVRPYETNGANLCYQLHGDGPLYVWNPEAQTWN